MPDPKTDPEGTLDWLLKKQKERKLTIQEQALLEQLMKALGEIDSLIQELEVKINNLDDDYTLITELYSNFYKGAAKETNPERYNQIINDLRENGVEIAFSDRIKPWEGGYQPTKGKAGRFKIHPNVELRTLEHEYQHFLDDKKYNYPGLEFYIRNRDIQYEMEIKSYELEMQLTQNDDSLSKKRKEQITKTLKILLKREKIFLDR